MYEIVFLPGEKKELYKSKISKTLKLPFGDLLTRMLRIKSNEDIDSFLKMFYCNELFDIVPGENELIPSKNFYTTILTEKHRILSAIQNYEEIKQPSKVSSKAKDDLRRKLGKKMYSVLAKLADYNKLRDALSPYFDMRLNNIKISPYPSALTQKGNKVIIRNYDSYEDEFTSKHSHLETNVVMKFVKRYVSNDILAIIWLELLEAFETNSIIGICLTCNNKYFNAKKATSKFCYICGPKSRKPSASTPEDKRRKNIIRSMQRGTLTIEEGNNILKYEGLKEYKPNKKKEGDKNSIN